MSVNFRYDEDSDTYQLVADVDGVNVPLLSREGGDIRAARDSLRELEQQNASQEQPSQEQPSQAQPQQGQSASTGTGELQPTGAAGGTPPQ